MKKIFDKIKKTLKKVLINEKKFILDNKFYNIYVVTNVLNALLLRILTVNNGLDIRPLIQDFVIVLAVGSIAFLMKKSVSKKIYLI